MMDATGSQREQALDRANRVRLGMADLKRDVKAGRVTLDDAVALPACQPMRVYDLLRALPAWGPSKASTVLRELGVASPTRRVGELTPRQLDLMLDVVADMGGQAAA